jgi:hypothetical protein
VRYVAASQGNRSPTFRQNVIPRLQGSKSRAIRHLKIRILCCFETSESDYPLRQRYITDEPNPQQNRCEISHNLDFCVDAGIIFTSCSRSQIL